MRLLHTSDWHLGVTLEGISRDPDHELFFRWLIETITARRIDVLVVAGDVFDATTPSAEAQRRFFGFLGEAAALPSLRRIVVVGGNHDSATRLEAPADVLAALRIDVVGELPIAGARDACLVPIRGDDGAVALVIVAVPYVHEWRLGVRAEGGKMLASAIADGFRDLYAVLADRAQALYPNVPLVATGHLTAGSWTDGDAPRAIHDAAHAGALSGDIFDERYVYVALGHIHHGYQVGTSRAWYSGSAIAVSVDEGKHPRRVLIVDIDGDGSEAARVEQVLVPTFRDLVAVSGDEVSVSAQLRAFESTALLAAIVVPKVTTETASLGLERRLREIAIARGKNRPIELLAAREIHPVTRPIEPASTVLSVRDATPIEVFEALCRARGVVLDDELRRVFESVVSP